MLTQLHVQVKCQNQGSTTDDCLCSSEYSLTFHSTYNTLVHFGNKSTPQVTTYVTTCYTSPLQHLWLPFLRFSLLLVLTVCAIQLLDQSSFDGLWKLTCLPVVSVSLTVQCVRGVFTYLRYTNVHLLTYLLWHYRIIIININIIIIILYDMIISILYTVSGKRVNHCIHFLNSGKWCWILSKFCSNNAMSNCKQNAKFQ